MLKKSKIKASFAALGLCLTGVASINNIRPGEFGLQETFYRFASAGIKEPGVYLQVPFAQFMHHYGANTQNIEFNAGSCRFFPTCANTNDKNALTAKIALNYRVMPDAKKLSFHRWEMDGFVMQDGYWLLSGLLNDSANTVMGRYTMAETLSHPDRFLNELNADFLNRIYVNTIPIEIESIELKEFYTSIVGSRTVHSGIVREPVVKSPDKSTVPSL
jgi:regulator of protease activity HflC (stomatin/prohibitin superfamily)